MLGLVYPSPVCQNHASCSNLEHPERNASASASAILPSLRFNAAFLGEALGFEARALAWALEVFRGAVFGWDLGEWHWEGELVQRRLLILGLEQLDP